MSRTKNTLLDSALIFGGAGLSTLFISTDGNGQNPIPVAAGMLLVISVVGVVSFALAWFVRTVPLAIVGSAAITELGFLLYFVCRVAFSQHVHDHAAEGLYLLPIVFAVVTAPTVLLSSIGFGRWASRVYQRRETEPNAGGNSAPPLQF
jgi:CHASE2 domain-containing sensor protein